MKIGRMNKLESEYKEKMQSDEMKSKIKKLLIAAETVRNSFSSFKTVENGGTPHFSLCGLRPPGKHNEIYDIGPKMFGKNIKICFRCGGVWTVYGFGWELVGFIDPNQESISSFISKEERA